MNYEIDSFIGPFRYLSNFYIAPVKYEGIVWQSSEHAYQAMKSLNRHVWEEIASSDMTPGQVKRYGAKLDMRKDWDQVKLKIMSDIVTCKFNQNPFLMALLLETKGCNIIEGNTWGDTYWGQCPIGNGKNHLGKILMGIRDDITRDIM